MSELFNHLKLVQQLEVSTYICRNIVTQWQNSCNNLKQEKKELEFQISEKESKLKRLSSDEKMLEQQAEEAYPTLENATKDPDLEPGCGLWFGATFGFWLAISVIFYVAASSQTIRDILVYGVAPFLAFIPTLCIYKFKYVPQIRKDIKERQQEIDHYNRNELPELRSKWIQTQTQKQSEQIKKTKHALEELQKENARLPIDIALAENNLTGFQTLLATIEEHLADLYNMNIIHPKYRGLIPVSMFCDYFDTGRCNSFTGHEGAYNLYEAELGQNRIISKLDGIEGRLDSLKSNMHSFVTSMQSAFNTINQNMVTNTNQMDSRLSLLRTQFSQLQQSADSINKQLENGVTLKFE